MNVESPPYENVILVTVGLSVIDKTLREVDRKTYDRWMGSGATSGELNNTSIVIEEVEHGTGLAKQREIEVKCFKHSQRIGNLDTEIRRGKRNRASAELSSLSRIFAEEKLSATNCRVVLVTTDSPDGVVAARINKRILAHRLFGCPIDKAIEWNNESDNVLDQSLGHLPIVRVRHLQVKRVADFRNYGAKNFIRLVCDEHKPSQPGKRIMNITGGFKGVIPIASVAAWAYYWQLVYLYEETDQLISPVRPGWINGNPESVDSTAPISSFGPLEQT